MKEIRSKLVTGAVVAAAAVGGATIANAATSGSSQSSTSPAASAPPAAGAHGRPAPPRDPSRSFHSLNGRSEQPLTGGTRAKVQAAALAKVKGTVERVETNIDDSAPYEAHIRKADGTEVTVEVNKDFTVASVQQMG